MSISRNQNAGNPHYRLQTANKCNENVAFARYVGKN